MLFVVKNALEQSESDRETVVPGTDVLPLRASALLRSDDRTVLGVSMWVADGELFVATEERLPLETEVHVALALPGHDETVRLEGKISFLHVADNDCDFDRTGMGIAISSFE